PVLSTDAFTVIRCASLVSSTAVTFSGSSGFPSPGVNFTVVHAVGSSFEHTVMVRSPVIPSAYVCVTVPCSGPSSFGVPSPQSIVTGPAIAPLPQLSELLIVTLAVRPVGSSGAVATCTSGASPPPPSPLPGSHVPPTVTFTVRPHASDGAATRGHPFGAWPLPPEHGPWMASRARNRVWSRRRTPTV